MSNKNKYDSTTWGTGEHLMFSPYLLTLEHNERVELLDKMITSAIKVLEDSTQNGYDLCEKLDKSIADLIGLYLHSLETKFLFPLWNQYDSYDLPKDSLVVQSTYIELRRAEAEFAIKKMRMINTAPKRYEHQLYFKMSQERLLRKISMAWAQEIDPSKSEQYMIALIEAVINSEGNISSIAIRGVDCSVNQEKAVRAIEMCCDTLKENADNLWSQKQVNSLVQTLSIGWIKSVKDPDEILAHIKARVKVPAKKNKK